MISTVSLLLLNEIIEAKHGNPHTVLGLHEIENSDGNAVLSARVFAPNTKKVWVVDDGCDDYAVELENIHTDGFFEKSLDRTSWFRYRLRFEDYEGNVWENYDPYSFPPVLSELDLHLFGEGTHYKLYEKLGAHPMTIDGAEGVLFAVWAPNARRVSVVGSFNNWDGRRHPMRVLSNSGIWEIFIPGLKNFDRYKYEIYTLTKQLLQKSDPYAVFSELRPSTSSLVFDISGYEWGDDKWIKNTQKKDIDRSPVNIYELHLGSWKTVASDGNRFMSYVELADELIPYVKDMGYTHIELMPVMEHPYDGSWGYQVTGYYSPTSRYGTPAEFMRFIDLCHRNNIGVILDWVPAHFPKDAHGLARFDGTALYEHENVMQGEHPDWGTLIFNFGRKEVKNFLIANALYWLDVFHIDGLRVDAVASMIYLDYGKSSGNWIPNKYGGRENIEAIEFIKHMNSVINGAFPKALMFAEESTSWEGVTRGVDRNGLGFSMKWNMGWMNDFLNYMSKEPIHRKYHHNNLNFGMVYAYSEKFVLVLSHDEVVHGKKSLINKMGGDIWQKCANLRVSLAFFMGHPGKKLLFMGGEFGHFEEWTEKHCLDWFLLDIPHHAAIHRYTKALNKLYLNERAFWYDDFYGHGFEWLDCNDSERSIISFVRKTEKDSDKLIIICNFTPATYENFRIGVDKDISYIEVFNSDASEFGGSGVVNELLISAEAREYNGKPYSVVLRLPPLGAVIIKEYKASAD